MPKQGVTSMFKFGENFGFIQGLLTACSIPYELVTPQKWKKEFQVTGDKNSSNVSNIIARLEALEVLATGNGPGVSLWSEQRTARGACGLAKERAALIGQRRRP